MKKTLIAAALAATTAFSVTPAALAETTAEVKESQETRDTKDNNELDPTKDRWDTNGASSDPAPDGGFPENSSTLNRVGAYMQSNHFKMLSLIVATVAAAITMLAKVGEIVLLLNPDLRARLGGK
ncbi:hypothetical protein CJ203_05515 [Corynebacterium tuscaniense]|uniref:Uncharacterized protein n=1 Tax=Corynebacterium tuscaniense TaxID=302449 RepID=A0A2N6T568_9CORY|nr:hypothetical protein [Corynebacterium tuscaniense]KAA8746734.1 hypothetical protein F4V54_00330 [Corynebacterium tuscaniense]KGF24962.1 hypothetical protein HMPREF2129_00885 [Corynebacterium tuscaniense DNF00037]PMC64466.1 hypothetical protein CJ203_05515 [Corynebacterium tuscaniense]